MEGTGKKTSSHSHDELHQSAATLRASGEKAEMTSTCCLCLSESVRPLVRPLVRPAVSAIRRAFKNMKKEEENTWADDGKLMIQSLLADVLKPRDRDSIWTVAYHLIASSVRLPISCWSHLWADHVTSLEVAHPGCRTRLASWRGAGLRQTKNYLLFSKDPHTHIHKNTRSHTPPFPFHTHTHALLRNHILIFWFKNKWRPCFSHCYTKFTMFTRT